MTILLAESKIVPIIKLYQSLILSPKFSFFTLNKSMIDYCNHGMENVRYL